MKFFRQPAIFVPLCVLISFTIGIGGALLMSLLMSCFIPHPLADIIGCIMWITVLIGFFADRISKRKF